MTTQPPDSLPGYKKTTSESPRVIGILSAMIEENQLIREALTEVHNYYILGTHIIQGDFYGTTILLATTGMGKVSAASVTALLLSHFGVNTVILTGFAGAVNEDLKLGDIVVPGMVFQYDVDCRPICDTPYQFPDINNGLFNVDPDLYEKAKAASIKFCTSDPVKDKGVLVNRNPIMTGDRFVDDKWAFFVDHLLPTDVQGIHPVAVDMESGAVAQVCYQSGVSFCVIRIISDTMSEKSNSSYDEFMKFVGEVGSLYSHDILKNLIPTIPRTL